MKNKISLWEIFSWITNAVLIIILFGITYVSIKYELVAEFGTLAYFAYVIPVLSSFLIIKETNDSSKESKRKQVNDIDSFDDEEFINLKQKYISVYENYKENIKKLKSKFKKITTITTLSFIIVSIGLFLVKDYLFVLMLLIFFCVVIIGTKVSIEAHIKFEEEYKEKILSNFIKIATSNLTYTKDSLKKKYEILKSEYMNANFDYTNGFNILFSLDDYIEGFFYDKIYIQTMNANIYYLMGKHSSNLLDGNLTIIDIKNDFDIKIYSNNSKNINKNNLINSSNLEFEKYFKIYSITEEGENKILSSEIINFLTNFRKKYKIDFDIAIKGKIYIRFYTGKIFAPKINGEEIDEESIYKYYVVTKFMKEFVEILENIK